jgi:hypothetical protein
MNPVNVGGDVNSTSKSKSWASASPRAAEPKSHRLATPNGSSSFSSARMDARIESGDFISDRIRDEAEVARLVGGR